jgi:hypothetical protein
MSTPTDPVRYAGADVLAAVQAWWQGTPAVQALTSDGALWHMIASEPVPEAYCTVFLVAEAVEVRTTRYREYRSTVQINCHAPTDAQARSMGLQIREALAGAPLAIGRPLPRDAMHVLPDSPGIAIGEGLGAGGRDCWIATETFDVLWTT